MSRASTFKDNFLSESLAITSFWKASKLFPRKRGSAESIAVTNQGPPRSISLRVLCVKMQPFQASQRQWLLPSKGNKSYLSHRAQFFSIGIFFFNEEADNPVWSNLRERVSPPHLQFTNMHFKTKWTMQLLTVQMLLQPNELAFISWCL